MIEQIKMALAQLEQEREIKILYAVESGSRAWGFASTDSDWDVRFIYVHKPEWYLSIDDYKDSIEEMLPDDLDLSGWELRKTLKLFRKSNPPLMEWLGSPIVYLENYSTAQSLRDLSMAYFNPKSCLYHYLHMAEGNFKEFLNKDTVKAKKYFYVLRPVLACQWIEETGSMAPMEFEKLVAAMVTDRLLVDEINMLLTRKRAGEELKEGPRIPIINDFLADRISYYQKYIGDFDITVQPETERLNRLFRSTLEEVK